MLPSHRPKRTATAQAAQLLLPLARVVLRATLPDFELQVVPVNDFGKLHIGSLREALVIFDEWAEAQRLLHRNGLAEEHTVRVADVGGVAGEGEGEGMGG